MLRRDVRFSSLDANLSQFEPWQNVTYQTGGCEWVGFDVGGTCVGDWCIQTSQQV